MTTPKRVAWKDIVAPPLDWAAPKGSDQDSEPGENQQDQKEQGTNK